MSSDFYFKKWKKTLADLEAILIKDIDFQETKAHDHKRCEATLRLSSVLSEYMYVYNQAWECSHMNLQVQKTSYINDILNAVASRIVELKHELKKLEVSEYHFFANGLIEIKRTNHDVDLSQITFKDDRPEHIQILLYDMLEKCREKNRLLEEEKNAKPVEQIQSKSWWNSDNVEEEETVAELKVEELTPEQKEFKKCVETIQAQERSRQVIQNITQQYNKRQRWINELNGTAKQSAPPDIREKSVKLIHKVCREYLALKRHKKLEKKRDVLLGLLPCRVTEKSDYKERLLEIETHRTQLKKKYIKDMIADQGKMRQDLLKRKTHEIKDDYGDKIRYWFREWYETVHLFHEIPKENQGGVAMIFKDDMPTPIEWLEEYKAYLAQKTANKNKTATEIKYEKMVAKRETMMQKKEEQIKKKLEAQLKQKIMKNPSLHPGFFYPESKKTGHILKVLNQYYKEWMDLDVTEAFDVKERYNQDINKNHAYMLARVDIIPIVAQDMRKELNLLQSALKKDYENEGKKMPEPMKSIKRKEKRKRKLQKTLSENVADKLECLALQGFIIDYPKTKLEDFIGDPNFCGGELRCNYRMASPFNGETRDLWWASCRELTHGFHRILLIGPRGGGKTKLLHALASINDAVLLELNARNIRMELHAAVYMEPLLAAVVACARAVQPCVIHIKHVHTLFYNKVPREDAEINWELFRNYFVKKLFRKIQKTDRITVVGTCVDPWMTKSKQMLKQFPTVVLLPNTSYSTLVLVLNKWIRDHPVIPADLDISSLAHVLKGYSFGFVQDTLQKFLSPERIVKIAARGLSPNEIFDFFLEESTEKIDYEKYLTWYLNKTTWAKKEKRHLNKQIAFQKTIEEFERKNKKKKDKAEQVQGGKQLDGVN